MRHLAIAALVLCPTWAAAQEPARPSIEQLVQRITDLRKQQAELKKQEDAAGAELKAELKRLQDLLDALNIDPRPPKPADPLRAKLKAAYDADPADAAKKREQAKDLAALYREAAKLTLDMAVPTSGELLARVKDAAGRMIGPNALVGCRKVKAAELGALLPTDEPLTDAQRKAVAALFGKLADVLDTF